MSHTVDQLVGLYVKMRDTKAAKKKEYEDWARVHDEKMEKVEHAMLTALNDAGAESIRTEHGTAYRKTAMRASIRDFGPLRDYILKTGNLDLLQKRVSTDVLRELRKPDAEGKVEEVPGVEVTFVAEVGVRRS